MSAFLAVNWETELRGALTVIIAVVILMGSVYLIMSTNLGSRLGFLVSLAALAGWMFIMGAIWWAYGKGLQGPVPSWEGVPGQSVIQEPGQLYSVGIIDAPITVGADTEANAAAVDTQLLAEDWTKLESSAPAFQQAASAAGDLLEETEAFVAGEFTPVNVFDIGGERYPKIGDEIDFLAFFHKPHFVIVEVAPLIQQITEPGRAPARPQIDTTRDHQYVYMIRDLGHQRRPAALICLGSLIVFLVLCYLLHRRDRIVAINRGQLALPSKAD